MVCLARWRSSSGFDGKFTNADGGRSAWAKAPVQHSPTKEVQKWKSDAEGRLAKARSSGQHQEVPRSAAGLRQVHV